MDTETEFETYFRENLSLVSFNTTVHTSNLSTEDKFQIIGIGQYLSQNFKQPNEQHVVQPDYDIFPFYPNKIRSEAGNFALVKVWSDIYPEDLLPDALNYDPSMLNRLYNSNKLEFKIEYFNGPNYGPDGIRRIFIKDIVISVGKDATALVEFSEFGPVYRCTTIVDMLSDLASYDAEISMVYKHVYDYCLHILHTTDFFDKDVILPVPKSKS